ncbi:thioredoxin-like domain-containing protein [Winogradskyella sp. 3972H.M.0a.05]|uniref:TlpA family protein disulfide reductase n=1 Tax=Winogradskyella sp. 3972H.M.0a.05 TaxID=2950277 RepID=UPI00339B08F7
MKKSIYFIFLFPLMVFSQHTISGTFSPAKEFTYAFLYKSAPDGASYVGRAELNEEGAFSIPLDSTSIGIYKIVYALPAEENNFDFIYDGKESISFTYDLNKGLEFTESSENKLWKSYTKSMEMVNMTISNFYQKESTDEKAYLDIFKTLNDTQNTYLDHTEGLLISELIKANQPYIPEGFEDINTYSQNLKSNYLKHIDFSSELLQSSDFLLDRVLTYVFGISNNVDNASYKTLVDDLANYIGDNDLVKVSLLDVVWSQFNALGNDELALYIIDKYLLDLAKKTGKIYLEERLSAYKNSAVGVKAPDFEIETTEQGVKKTTSLHNIDSAEQYLVVFWSSTCGHCLNELPEVMKLAKEKANLKVIAFGLEDDADNWKKEIANFPDFTHVIGLQKWENPTAKQYNISATPSYFLLDRNKTIIAKPHLLADLQKALK